MFDIGGFELLLIVVVGLLVIGPERMPETLRTVALWWGRLKRSLADTRSAIEKEIGADEIRMQLHNEAVMKSIEKSRQSVEQHAKELFEDDFDYQHKGDHNYDPATDPNHPSYRPSSHEQTAGEDLPSDPSDSKKSDQA